MTKKCPQCLVNIEKSGGCLHMVCHVCKYDFCWDCLQNYIPGHIRNFHPEKKMAAQLNVPLLQEMIAAQRNLIRQHQQSGSGVQSMITVPILNNDSNPSGNSQVALATNFQVDIPGAALMPVPNNVGQVPTINRANKVLISESVFNRAVAVVNRHNLMPNQLPIEKQMVSRNVLQDGNMVTQKYYLVDRSVYETLNLGLQQLLLRKATTQAQVPTPGLVDKREAPVEANLTNKRAKTN